MSNFHSALETPDGSAACTNELYGQLESLSDLIEPLGGRTELTVDRDPIQAAPEREANHVRA
jgi:hypothetical protein